MDRDIRTGLAFGMTAYTLWGSLPVFFRALAHLPADEILAHRVIWALLAGLVVIAAGARWEDVRAALRPARLPWLMLSAALIGGNWLIFIYAVSVERVMESSLGYYINPLVSVLFGLIFFSEKLRPLQWVAIAIAAAGVILVAGAYGRVPWIALSLCTLFASYGAVRKHIGVEGRAGFLVEAALLTPFAVAWLGWLIASGDTNLMGERARDLLLLPLLGPVTAAPLICFAIAANRLKLSTLGMMQYTAPTLQFLVALLIFREPFAPLHGVAFAIIWLALGVFTFDSWRASHRASRAARRHQPA